MHHLTTNSKKFRKAAAAAALLPFFTALTIIALAGPLAARAEGTPAPSGGGTPSATVAPFQTYSIEPPIKANVPQVIGRFVNMIIGVTGSMALLMFAYGGFTWLTSRGNPEQIQKGKNVFIWATIGLIIIFSSYMILTNVFKVIGATD